jgi:hypothetical protein
MFTKLEQCSWIKIEVSQGRGAQDCFWGLREACDNTALPYLTVAQWVKVFREGRDAVQDDPMLTTTQFSSLPPCWMLIADGLCVS